MLRHEGAEAKQPAKDFWLNAWSGLQSPLRIETRHPLFSLGDEPLE
jgi:hypothetical protein